MREFELWGEAFGPAAGLPPGAGKRKILGEGHEPYLDGVPFDVVLHSGGLLVAADQVVVAFVLPERPVLQSKHADRLVSCEAFQRAKPFSRWHVRRHEKMHVIRHDYECGEFIASESVFAIGQRPYYHFGYFGTTQKHWAAPGVIEQAIHSYERLSGCEVGWPEDAAIRETSVQAERHEYSFAHNIQVRKAPFVPAHVCCSGSRGWFVSGILKKVAPGGSPAAGPKPRPTGPAYERF